MSGILILILFCLISTHTAADDITVPETDTVQIETISDIETDPSGEPDSATEPETEPVTEPVTEPETEPETEPATEPTEIQTKEGWIHEGDSFYYYVDDVAVTGWHEIDGSWFYFFASGKMATGWQQIDGNWYYLKGSGRMATGWIKLNENWYYLRSSGKMATGWQLIDGNWYYLQDSGRMATGWLKYNGKWYYLKASGAMAIGWLKINGVWYCFTKSGAMNERNIRIAICGTYGSENDQVDDDLYAQLTDLGASVKKVSSSVDPLEYDGLVIPGGRDITPSLYGESDYACHTTNLALDREQLAIVDKFIKAGKPVLGVCRGIELLNVYFGGSLYQDIGGHQTWHNVSSLSGSALSKACGSGFSVRSAHHQALKTLGDGLRATQWAPDNVVEAIEHVSLPVVGVLWHPEWTGQKGTDLLRYFIYSMCRSTTTGWHRIKGEWYYFERPFIKASGWKVIDGKWYYFKSSGAMAKKEWVKGFWWLSADGTWKYTYQGSWIQDSRGWRFEDTSGWFAKDETVTINGKQYSFDIDGYMK